MTEGQGRWTLWRRGVRQSYQFLQEDVREELLQCSVCVCVCVCVCVFM